MAMKILVVDDEEFNRDILQDALEDQGFTVLLAEHGADGLKQLEAHPDVAVIVLDRMMPVMDGMEMVSVLKQDERFKEIPVIMQTAAANQEQVQEGVRAGVYYYLAKPYERAVMVTLVNTALKERETNQLLQAELDKTRRMMGLMERGRFVFRTLQEATTISYFIANCFPDAKRVVTGLNELLINAIEHGNLGISYAEKTQLVLEGRWMDEIDARLKQPDYWQKFASLEFDAQPGKVTVTIQDQGRGFEWNRYLAFEPERAMDVHGRGIAMSKARSFDELEYIGSGNIVRCVVHR